MLKLSCGVALKNDHFLNANAEVWVEDHIIRLLYRGNGEVDVAAQKEILRSLKSIDPDNAMPLLLEMESQVTIHKEARELAHRISNKNRRPAIAMIAYDLSDKIQANFYAHFYKPLTPFQVFYRMADAERWLLSRVQEPIAESA